MHFGCKVTTSFYDWRCFYQEFIKMYYTLRHLGLHNGCYIMGTYIEEELNLTDGMTHLEIHGSFYNQKGLIFRMLFRLGEDFGIDYQNSKFLDGHDTTLNFSNEDICKFESRVRIKNSLIRSSNNMQ